MYHEINQKYSLKINSDLNKIRSIQITQIATVFLFPPFYPIICQGKQTASSMLFDSPLLLRFLLLLWEQQHLISEEQKSVTVKAEISPPK